MSFEVPHGVTRERYVFRLEVGLRAAMRADETPRDERWWKGLDFEGRQRRW